jgi:hypothetical protein
MRANELGVRFQVYWRVAAGIVGMGLQDRTVKGENFWRQRLTDQTCLFWEQGVPGEHKRQLITMKLANPI